MNFGWSVRLVVCCGDTHIAHHETTKIIKLGKLTQFSFYFGETFCKQRSLSVRLIHLRSRVYGSSQLL